jgi:hypothetical protein
MLRDHLGVPARRALGAGRKDDIGDITGVPYTVIQVANWQNVAKAVREKPLECEQQRVRAWRQDYQPTDEVFGATFIRLRGGDYRVVLTPERFFALWREAA